MGYSVDLGLTCWDIWGVGSVLYFCIVSLNHFKFLWDFVVCQKSQDTENGGISDRPDDAVDVYHTYFGVAGN